MIRRCPIVRTIADDRAIEGLTALYDPQATIPMDARAYRFDIVLRGRARRCSRTGLEGN